MTDDRRLVHLVDDDDAIRRSVGFALKTSGFQVRAYASGSELLKEAPDLETGLHSARHPDAWDGRP